MNIKILPIAFVLFSKLLLAQDEHLELPNIIPPSPNAFELSKVGQLPVGLFTGAINTDIPLFTYKTNNLSLPISLSYNSNGIKVDQIPSVAGLGWNMNVGGVISRIVRDEDDQDDLLFYPEADINSGIWNNSLALDYFYKAAQGGDSEPDIYMFNFLGYSGQFVFDNNNTDLLIIPAQALKIEAYCEEPRCGFMITTPDGVKHIFLDAESTDSRMLGDGAEHAFPKTVEKPDVLTNFEMWLDAPSSGVGEAATKIGANILYGMANSPYSLLTGKTLGGTELNSKEKTDAFVDTAPGLLSLGLTGTKSVIKVTEKGLDGFNKLVKAAPELTTTKGLPSGMKWQTHAGQVFQWNKVSSQGLNSFNQGLKTTSVIKELEKERKK